MASISSIYCTKRFAIMALKAPIIRNNSKKYLEVLHSSFLDWMIDAKNVILMIKPFWKRLHDLYGIKAFWLVCANHVVKWFEPIRVRYFWRGGGGFSCFLWSSELIYNWYLFLAFLIILQAEPSVTPLVWTIVN